MIPKKVAELRERIGQLKQQIGALERGDVPVPIAIAEQRIDAALEQAEQAARKHLRMEAELAVSPSSDYLPRLLDIYRGQPDTDVLAGLLVLTGGKALRKTLVEFAQAHIDAAGGSLSAEQQTARLAELKDQLLDAEMAEHAEVEKSRAAGQQIEHRADIDPAVLLGLT